MSAPPEKAETPPTAAEQAVREALQTFMAAGEHLDRNPDQAIRWTAWQGAGRDLATAMSEHGPALLSALSALRSSLAASEERLRKGEEIVHDVWAAHRDPESTNYNECEKPGEECMWCDWAINVWPDLPTFYERHRAATLTALDQARGANG